MVEIRIPISKEQQEIFQSIAIRLHEEHVLKEPTIESLLINTIEIICNEYVSDAQSLAQYFKKKVGTM